MPVFAIQQPITTTVPTVLVENSLPVGVHMFELVVVNAQGVRSDPTRIPVTVVQRIIPPVVPVGPPIMLDMASPQTAATESAQPPASSEKAAVPDAGAAPTTVKKRRKKTDKE